MPVDKLLKLKADLVNRYGEEAIMFAADMPVRPPISSGSLALDFATGIGGLPTDRVIEVAGADGSGKTTLGLLAMQNFLDLQPNRGAVILDTEHKLTADWCEQLIGPERMNRVMLAWPDHMEQAHNIYVEAVASGLVSFVLFDSIGGSPTMRTAQKDAEKGEIGGNSLAVGRFARMAGTYSQKYNCLTFGINQVRADMDGFHRHMTPGGHAWKHHCIMRIQLKRGQYKVHEEIDGEVMQVGYNIVAKLVKNQLAAPGRQAWWWFYNVPTEKYGFGIDTTDEVVRLAILTRVIGQKAAMYYHPDLPDGKVRGLPRLNETIKASDPLRITIIQQTMDVLNKGGESLASAVAPISDPDADIDESALNILTKEPDFDAPAPD
jgi:recombination protein RecA